MNQDRVVYVERPADNNTLGLAGFIVSLVSLLICGGLISPIGMIISIVAMKREPKGFAIAGLVLGLIGSIWFFIALALGLFGVVLAAILAALGAAAGSGTSPPLIF